MDIIGLIALAILIFCLGWVTGNVVEWILVSRERRLREARIADLNNELFEGRRGRGTG